MKLELEIYGSFCSTSTFTINGIAANSRDFGYQYDQDPYNAEDYGCGDMRFETKPAEPEVLAKYNITEPEYNIVAGQLEKGLSFGTCRWCV